MEEIANNGIKYKYPFPLFKWLLFIWPFGAVFSVFLLDDPTVKGLGDIVRHYVVISAVLYPAFVFLSTKACYKAFHSGGSKSNILLFGMIPIFSGLPWFFIFLLGLYVSSLI